MSSPDELLYSKVIVVPTLAACRRCSRSPRDERPGTIFRSAESHFRSHPTTHRAVGRVCCFFSRSEPNADDSDVLKFKLCEHVLGMFRHSSFDTAASHLSRDTSSSAWADRRPFDHPWANPSGNRVAGTFPEPPRRRFSVCVGETC